MGINSTQRKNSHKSYFKAHHDETRIGTKERTENIAFTANKHQCKKNFKKTILDQACVIIITNQNIESKNEEIEK